jgi:class 3 adenylate cyclase
LKGRERIIEDMRKAGVPRRMTETRKLAAILVADVVGYSRLAGADEDRTLSRLRALRRMMGWTAPRTASVCQDGRCQNPI